MKRTLLFLYGVVSYAVFFGVFLYAIGFIGNILVPKSMDSAPVLPFWTSLAINLGLLSLCAIQHSGMARPAFKRWITKFIPKEAERPKADLAIGCATPEGSAVCEVGPGHVRCPRETMEIELDGGRRDVHWQVPAGEAPPEGWPVAFMFQGALFPASLSWSGRKGAPLGAYHQARLTMELLDAGFAVVTPEAAGEGLTCWSTNLPGEWEDTRDAELMEELLLSVEHGELGPLDPDDLVAVGISSGGYMTSRMATAHPGRFRALVIAYVTDHGDLRTIHDGRDRPVLDDADLPKPAAGAGPRGGQRRARHAGAPVVVDGARGHAGVGHPSVTRASSSTPRTAALSSAAVKGFSTRGWSGSRS